MSILTSMQVFKSIAVPSIIAAAKVCAIAIMATSELHANIIIRLSMRNLREPEAVC